MIWNPGDDTDLNEGAGGTDTVEVNGGGGLEQFTATANGTRVRFDRLNPAPFAIDIGTCENLVFNANGGDDSFSATGNLAALIKLTVDGGTGNDSLLGSNGVDVLLGGDGNDFVDGQQGNDAGFLGAGNDVFQWDPGDGSDIIEGQDGSDRLLLQRERGQRAVPGVGQRRARALHAQPRQHRDGHDDVEAIDLSCEYQAPAARPLDRSRHSKWCGFFTRAMVDAIVERAQQHVIFRCGRRGAAPFSRECRIPFA